MKGTRERKEEERGRELLYADSFPRFPQQSGLGQTVEVWSPEFHLSVSHVGCKNLDHRMPPPRNALVGSWVKNGNSETQFDTVMWGSGLQSAPYLVACFRAELISFQRIFLSQQSKFELF